MHWRAMRSVRLPARREHVGIDRQGLEVERERIRDVLGLGARLGDARGDRLADEAQLVDR
jgi:hypothetical protein